MDEAVKQDGGSRVITVPREVRLEAELLQRRMENIQLRMQALNGEARECAEQMGRFTEECKVKYGFDLAKSRIADDGTVLPVVGHARQGG